MLTLNSRRKVVSKKKSKASRVRWEIYGFKKHDEKKVEEKKVEDVEPASALAKLRARKRQRGRKQVKSE
jgi:hypothetical protein